MTTRILILASLLIVVGCSAKPQAAARAPRSFDTTQPVSARPIDQAIVEGVAFLKKSQNDDGSWGTGLQTRGTEIYHQVPGSHDAFRVATSALCVMALREAGEAGSPEHLRGVKYLTDSSDARRDTGALLYNIWAHKYSVQALAMELPHVVSPAERSAMLRRIEYHVDRLRRYEAYNGGWNYYDFVAQTQQPSLEATSFGTSAALVALLEARDAGAMVPQVMIDRSIRRIEECRMPNGAYLYGSDSRFFPQGVHNQMKGSTGRMQSCNFALWTAGSKLVGPDESLAGLKILLDNHEWIEVARKRPYPHEAWYANSGYYYYFGHYYASRVLEKLQTSEKSELARRLADYVLPHQESDGSWWDYAMWDYHKPYGTAYAVMTLLRCREAINPGSNSLDRLAEDAGGAGNSGSGRASHPQ
jgi:hypothetical protein